MIEKIYINKNEILIQPHKNVYFPFEDSYLLMKNLKNIEGKVLEIGTGSGVISIYLAKTDNGKIKKIISTDINKYALENAKKNAILNKVENKICFVYSDLFKNIKKEKFDYIIFNPPYLPTTKKERLKTKLNFAFDGGMSGLRTIYKFLKQAKKFLKKRGSIYLIVSDLSDLKKFEKVTKDLEYIVKEIDRESFFFERIILYKIKCK